MLKIALIGRPNVGKSTLFNKLTHSVRALVADEPGVTRDRHYGIIEHDNGRCLLIDTGGITFGKQDLERMIFAQTDFAIREAELVCLMACAKEGLTPLDIEIAGTLRRQGKTIWLIINKIDGQDEAAVFSEFSSLGIETIFYTMAPRGYGVKKLRQAFAAQGGEQEPKSLSDKVRVTFFGRPNVGKSTLINHLLGEDRLLSFNTPGTTRDSVAVDFSYAGTDFSLVDTAGIRRRKLDDGIEKISVLKALESALMSDVVVLVCDAEQSIESQDATLAARALAAGCALVVAVNKQDLINTDNRSILERSIDLKLRFLTSVSVCFVSAKHGQGLKRLLRAVKQASESARVQLATSKCTRLLQSAVTEHELPLVAGKRIKLRYAHQGGTCPPRFIVYGSRVEKIPSSYRRYLENFFCKRLNLVGTPVIFEFRRTENPYSKAD